MRSPSFRIGCTYSKVRPSRQGVALSRLSNSKFTFTEMGWNAGRSRFRQMPVHVSASLKETDSASKDIETGKGPSGPGGLPPELWMLVVAAIWGSNPACLRYPLATV